MEKVFDQKQKQGFQAASDRNLQFDQDRRQLKNNRSESISQETLQGKINESSRIKQISAQTQKVAVHQLKINEGTYSGHLNALVDVGSWRLRSINSSLTKGSLTTIPGASPLQLRIQAGTYNRHITALGHAGSRRAGLSHPEHNEDSVPDRYGQDLVDEAQQDEEDARAAGNNALADAIRVAVRAAKRDFGFYR